METVEKRGGFSGRLGFILATAGAAVGLGNLWRFPYLAEQYGGGIFLLVYLILVVTFGVVMVITELAIGRRTGKSCFDALMDLCGKYPIIGWIAMLVPMIIVPYYCVIGGWVTKYFADYAVGAGSDLAGAGFFDQFISMDLGGVFDSPLPWFLIYAFLTIVVVVFGVEKGIERMSKILMPALFVLLIAICVYMLTIDGISEGLKYYLVPDFDKLSFSTLAGAVSQLFYSLSIAMGILITFGSYMKKDVPIESSTRNVEVFDTAIAIMAGLMIIPAVYVFLGTEGMASGPSLTFISLPKVFAAMGGVGRVIGAVFFLALGFAALTSCVSVMETLVANCMEIFHKSRKEMCAVVGVYSLVTAVLICLGYNALYFELPLPNGSTAQLLDVMDYISNSFLMPFISLLTSILVGWVVGPKWIIAEVEKNGEHFRRAKLYSVMMRYVVPVVMLILFLTSTGLGSLIFAG